MYLLSNMAIFGIYVRFQGGITFSCPEKCFNRGISVPQNPHSLDRELDVKHRAALFNRSWPVEHVETWLSILLEHVATMDPLQKNWGCFPCFFLNAPMKMVKDEHSDVGPLLDVNFSCLCNTFLDAGEPAILACFSGTWFISTTDYRQKLHHLNSIQYTLHQNHWLKSQSRKL